MEVFPFYSIVDVNCQINFKNMKANLFLLYHQTSNKKRESTTSAVARTSRRISDYGLLALLAVLALLTETGRAFDLEHLRDLQAKHHKIADHAEVKAPAVTQGQHDVETGLNSSYLSGSKAVISKE